MVALFRLVTYLLGLPYETPLEGGFNAIEMVLAVAESLTLGVRSNSNP
jgi:hypothetical protein